MSIRGGLGVILGASLAASGCGGVAGDPASCVTSNEDAGLPTSSTFLAFDSNFGGFRRWPSFPVPGTSEVDSVHVMGPRVEYVNYTPPHGSTAFPVGTIIVKETAVGALPDRTVFAMVKRGGDTNTSGAKDWEWFDLKNVDDTCVTIIWRGVGPPAGETYGGDPNASCNSCHLNSKANDFVQSAALQLGNF